ASPTFPEREPSCSPLASWWRRAARSCSGSRLRLLCGQLPQHHELGQVVGANRCRFQLSPVARIFDRQQRQEFSATDLIASQHGFDRRPRIGQDAVHEQREALLRGLDSGGGFGDLATELELGVAQLCRSSGRIRARGIGEPALLAPRPDWEAQAYERVKETREGKLSKERWPVPIAR